MQPGGSPSGSSSWGLETSVTSTRRQSRHKFYLISPPSGLKPSYLTFRTCPILGQCISMGQRSMKVQAQVSYSYHQKATSFAMSYRWTSPHPQITKQNTRDSCMACGWQKHVAAND